MDIRCFYILLFLVLNDWYSPLLRKVSVLKKLALLVFTPFRVFFNGRLMFSGLLGGAFVYITYILLLYYSCG